MPQVRIDLLKGKSADYRSKVGQATYEALVETMGVPKDDRFQVIAEHDPGGLIYDPGYLGIERTQDLIMIQITLNEGRSTDQKRALYKAIADGLHAAVGLRRQDVLIDLVEVKKENWSFGDGEAQYAT
jgi:phenylpyruvate tautomerase PptA (4-oxalocrotonate tautomerase family)